MLQVKIKGMSCEHCVSNVKENLEKAGAKNVRVNLDLGYASFDEGITLEVAKEIINDLGFEAE